MQTAGLTLFVLLLMTGFIAAAPREVTNDDIRAAILSLVHMFRDFGDKLERHEYRERQLGDQVKKTLVGIDKRQRITESRIEALSDFVNRIESRIRSFDESNKNQASNVIPTDTLIARLELAAARLEAAAISEPPVSTPTPPSVETTTQNNKLKEEINSLSENLTQQFKKLDSLRNETKSFIKDLSHDVVENQEKGMKMLNDRIKELALDIKLGHEEISKRTSEVSLITENTCMETSKEYEKLFKEVKTLSKMEQLLVQTADNVLDAKRRIEFGSHQVVMELSDFVRTQADQLNNTIQNRFNAITSSIMDNQSGALGNLTTKLETEMNQVWRQIGIMYQQLSNSAGALHKLQEQTDAYVNGSVATMGSMQGKVITITSRIAEVDENLNYLLGRLSLVTQDFSQIKKGLTDALDDIRYSFLSVQKKISSVRERNPITSEEAAAGALPEDPTGLNPPKPPLEDVENHLSQ